MDTRTHTFSLHGVVGSWISVELAWCLPGVYLVFIAA